MAKQVWQITRSEYVKKELPRIMKKYYSKKAKNEIPYIKAVTELEIRKYHSRQVKQALAKGKPVPARVLASCTELKGKR